MSDSEPQDHFHRIVSGNARTRLHVVLGSIFVLVWFGIDVGEVIYDHWNAAPACTTVYAPMTLTPGPLMPTPNFYGTPRQGPARNDPTPGIL